MTRSPLKTPVELAPERVVISPGPCTPAEAGTSVSLIREIGAEIPILGVCLGHQAIAKAFGGKVVRADEPVHGKVTRLRHVGVGPFEELPSTFQVARYHSLTVDPACLPEELEAIAWSETSGGATEIQAIRHRHRPVWGVQFHPESIACEHGEAMILKFLALT